MERDLSEAFRVLKERIRRLSVIRVQGYIKNKPLRYYYPGKSLTDKLKFEYLKVVTTEGQQGVIHILYFGDYIPQKWLSEAWHDITGSAYIVDIRATKGTVKATKRLARYCVAQYVAGQSEFLRYSWSWGWVCKGFVKWWKEIIKLTGDIRKAIFLWDELLSGKEIFIGRYKVKPPPDIGIVICQQKPLPLA